MIVAKFYLVLLAVSLGSGVIGGVTVHLIGRPKTPPKSSGSTTAAAEPSGDLSGRVESLEKSVSALERERRMRSLVAAQQDDDDDPTAPDAGPRRAVVDDPVFETAVRDVLEQVETERTAERQSRVADRRRQAAERLTNDLATELALNDGQKAKVLEVVQSFYDELRAMREGDGGAELPRSEWRQRSRELRDKSEGKLGQILSASQLEKYKTLEDDKRLGAGGGGRRPRRGGGGD